jgi:hypothetical protein
MRYRKGHRYLNLQAQVVMTFSVTPDPPLPLSYPLVICPEPVGKSPYLLRVHVDPCCDCSISTIEIVESFRQDVYCISWLIDTTMF